MPVEELAESSGHWVWQQDVGTRWLLDETAGPAATLLQQAFAPDPEHWFKVREDGKWVVRVLTTHTQASGEEEVLDVGGKPQEGVTLLGGEEVSGVTRAYVEANRLVIEWQGKRAKGTRVHLKNYKEVVLGKYHSTVEDLVRNVKGTRIFKRYPWYRIENLTGETITLKTFLTSDFMYLIPAMSVEVKPGASYVDASAGDKDEEQAVFGLADGRDITCLIKAFQSVTLRSADFRQTPAYEIENLTNETVTLTTYSTSDFLYLVPSLTVEVAPGTSFVTTASRDTQEEQAVFMLLDGRSYKGFNIKAFERVTLRREHFQRYPYYKIENMTGETVSLTTHAVGDFVYIVPSMIVDVAPGTAYVHGSSGDVMEEQASFRLQDGRSFSGFKLKAYQTVVLKPEFFS
mmetsp:Transcript_27425/g.79057  ORF Transcript_27425/g.79057 Transcript_27425/m.79057 type:complete len:402 (+) Transcript_27425:97-1302(+)